MRLELILDIETDGYEGNTLWLIVTQEVASKEQRVFTAPFNGFREYVAQAARVIGHHILGFDWPVLQRHIPDLPAVELYDTLVVSRLLNYAIEGGHSLDSWGQRLGRLKGKFKDFSRYSEEMLEYCKQDVRVTAELYEYQRRYHESPRWQPAIATEHHAAVLAKELHDVGFQFNTDGSGDILDKLSGLLADLDARILGDPAFGPRVAHIRDLTPRITKHGTLNATDVKTLVNAGHPLETIVAGQTYAITKTVPFNPGSPKQMVERLNEFGWKPYEKTKTHIQLLRERKRKDPEKVAHFDTYGWKVNEANLATLPDTAPQAAHLLAQRLIVSARVSDLQEWRALVQPDQRIHGSFLPIGSWTHRMAHQKPNTANIGKQYGKQEKYTPVELLKLEWDGQLRCLWEVPKGHWQIGVDMESAHLRILAHYMDDPQFTKGLLSGSKEDGTDPHSLNQKALGRNICQSRDIAKRFIYTWLNGAGAPKVASILGCSLEAAKVAILQFIEFYPGLDRIINEDIPKDAARGFFEGIDGRFVMYGQTHGMLAGYLQNAEAIILKRTAWEARKKCWDAGWPIKLINLVHDEIQIELEKDDEELAHRIGAMFADEFRISAEHYGLRCPFAGGVSVGHNWGASH